MQLLRRLRLFQVIGTLSLFVACVHGRRKYPEKVHEMVQERLARRRYGSAVGQWSSWGSWSACSLSCGGGVATQTRDCLPRSYSYKHHHRRRIKDRLSNSQCIGIYKRFHMCNEQACPPPANDLREQQCAAYDGKPYMGKMYRWRPHYSKSRPCALSCQPVGFAFYVTLSHAVKDGTRCSPRGGRDREDFVCAAGMCKHIGCDGVVGSGRVLDACGECGGNNSTCQIISGIFTEPYLEAGYRLVAQIPAAACSIRIEELGATKNYLALRDSKGKFIINGDWNIDMSGVYRGAGASFTYRRKQKAGELISAQGPITEPVDIFILYRQANRGIKYEYAIKRNASLTSVLPRLPTMSGGAEVPPLADTLLRRPADQPRPRDVAAPPLHGPFVSPLYQKSPAGAGPVPFTGADSAKIGPKRRRRRRRRRHRFQWVVTGYTECSKSCGGGTKTTEVVCMKRKRKQLAPDRDCDAATRPLPSTASCNTNPCPARWEPGVWSACSVSCGGGQQTRPVRCVSDGREVAPALCPGQPPPAQQDCRQLPCPAGLWQIGAWSQCSVTCGWGSRSRRVSCASADGVCSELDRPRETAPCRRPACDGSSPPAEPTADSWMFTGWSEQCSVDCGQGVQWRQVACLGSCDAQLRPEETRPCKTDRSCEGTWFTGPWSRCSHQCGSGEQTRPVTCVRLDDGQFAVAPESACAAGERPAGRRGCSGGRCPVRWHASSWTACSVSCGRGQQTRAVACLAADGAARPTCPAGERPERRRICLLSDCPGRAFSAGNGTTPRTSSEYAAPPSGDSGNYTFVPSPSDVAAGDQGSASSRPTERYDVVNSIAHDHPAVSTNELGPTPGPGEDGGRPPTDPLTSASAAAEGTEAPGAAPGEVRPARRRHRQRKHRKHRQRPSADEHRRRQSTGSPAETTPGSCADRFNNCLLVQQARLCKYKYYKNACCATCKGGKDT